MIFTKTLARAVIANGESLSGAIHVGDFSDWGIIMPDTWTAANLTFQVCDTESGTYVDLYDSSGNEVSVTVAASRGITGLPDITQWSWLKIRSGTAAAAVNQAAERIIRLVGKG